MGLTGHINDFSIVDTLQYLHSAQKSGVLYFEEEASKAELTFERGEIIGATKPGMPSLGQILCREGLISNKLLEKALRIQHLSEKKKPLGHILQEMGIITRKVIRDTIASQIERVIEDLLTWKGGIFHFEIRELSAPDDISFPLKDLALPEEISTGLLLLEALKNLDETNHSIPGSGESDFSERSVPEIEKAELEIDASREADSGAGAKQKRIELLFRVDSWLESDKVAAALRGFQFRTQDIGSLKDLEKYIQVVETGVTSIMVIEISSDSELNRCNNLLKKVGERTQEMLFIFIVNDFRPKDIITLYAHGAHAIFPKSKENDEEIRGALRTVVLQRLKETLSTLQLSFSFEGDGENIQLGFLVFKQFLMGIWGDKNNHEIVLGFLRLLAQFVQRSIIFLVKEKELLGIGGFGSAKNQVEFNDSSKKIHIKLKPGTLLAQSINDQVSFNGTPDQEEWMDDIYNQVGRPKSREIALIPVAGIDRLIYLIYCDKGATLEPMQNFDIVECASYLTGLAIENAFLRKQKND